MIVIPLRSVSKCTELHMTQTSGALPGGGKAGAALETIDITHQYCSRSAIDTRLVCLAAWGHFGATQELPERDRGGGPAGGPQEWRPLVIGPALAR